MSMFGEILTPAQLAEELGMEVTALAQWRYRGDGPPFLKEGRWIRYRVADVEAWLENRLHTRTDTLARPKPSPR